MLKYIRHTRVLTSAVVCIFCLAGGCGYSHPAYTLIDSLDQSKYESEANPKAWPWMARLFAVRELSCTVNR